MGGIGVGMLVEIGIGVGILIGILIGVWRLCARWMPLFACGFVLGEAGAVAKVKTGVWRGSLGFVVTSRVVRRYVHMLLLCRMFSCYSRKLGACPSVTWSHDIATCLQW